LTQHYARDMSDDLVIKINSSAAWKILSTFNESLVYQLNWGNILKKINWGN
jgi:hypothetical protein